VENLPILLELLMVLPEEVNCHSLRVTDDQRYPFIQVGLKSFVLQ
jgi:hypothetical protein